jgi:hypothetical protein
MKDKVSDFIHPSSLTPYPSILVAPDLTATQAEIATVARFLA